MTSPREERRSVRRGDIYLANLIQAGGRLWKRRPVLVVQNDLGNRRSPETIVAGIRSAGGPKFPIHVAVARGTGGLDKDSLVDAGQILTLHQGELGSRIGALPPELMRAVDQALRVSLGLI